MTEDEFNSEMNDYIMSIVSDAYKCMNKGTMSMPSIQGYIRHLPIVGIEEGYPKEIYNEVAKCIVSLWKYAKAKHYITENTSFITFLEEDCNFNKLSDKEILKPLKELTDFIYDDIL